MHAEFIRCAIAIIDAIPAGKVLTYGAVAVLAGNPRGARQVTRVLHSLSGKEGSPWYQVIGARGNRSLPCLEGREEQAALLRAEGVIVSDDYQVNLEAFHWREAVVNE
nr:MGMT family protein [Candidatus Sigynarchaeum springense]